MVSEIKSPSVYEASTKLDKPETNKVVAPKLDAALSITVTNRLSAYVYQTLKEGTTIDGENTVNFDKVKQLVSSKNYSIDFDGLANKLYKHGMKK